MKTKEDQNPGQDFINRIWSSCFCTCCPDNECALISTLCWGEKNSILLAHCIASNVSSSCMHLNNRKVYSLRMKCHWIFNGKLRYLSKIRFSEFTVKRKASTCERISVFYLVMHVKNYAFTPQSLQAVMSVLLVGNRLFVQTPPALYFHVLLNFLSEKDHSWWYLKKRIPNKNNGTHIAACLTEQDRADDKKDIFNICPLNK